ncbi:hypothetical protein WQ54_22510 [Bacillus sp. SA1-12]|nr:hypothetical protein WQ54_22510 [Bacillus sp. SA1-12]
MFLFFQGMIEFIKYGLAFMFHFQHLAAKELSLKKIEIKGKKAYGTNFSRRPEELSYRKHQKDKP